MSIFDIISQLAGGNRDTEQGRIPSAMDPFSSLNFLQKLGTGLQGTGAVNQMRQRLAPRNIGTAMPWLENTPQPTQFPGIPTATEIRPQPASALQTNALLRQQMNKLRRF